MTRSFDAIVVGVGGVGSSTLYHLAKRGLRVLGIEQFGIAHDRGSSHGETRAIRKAYFEHPDYVPLLQEAYQCWQRIEEEWGKRLLHIAGLVEIGPSDGVLISGVRRACLEHGLALEELSRAELSDRMPGFHLPEGQEALFEADGGYLLVEECVQAMATLAERSGAEAMWDCPVESWRVDGNSVVVQAGGEQFVAERLILATGAWAVPTLGDLGVQCRVLKKHLHWIEVPFEAYREDKGSPLFFYETNAGYYYGFPQLDCSAGAADSRRTCIKVAEHSGGERLRDPDDVERKRDAAEQERVANFLSKHLTYCKPNFVRHASCMYTMTPDEHFIVDKHPNYPQVCIAAGLSGHGFKFASVLGQKIADLATGPAIAEHPFPFLSLARFS